MVLCKLNAPLVQEELGCSKFSKNDCNSMLRLRLGRLISIPIIFLKGNFRSLLKSEGFVDVKRWEGFRLLAVDGSNISMLNVPEVLDHFGSADNQFGSLFTSKR